MTAHMEGKLILKKQTLNYKKWGFFKPRSILRVGFFKGYPKTVGFFMVGFFMIPSLYGMVSGATA